LEAKQPCIYVCNHQSNFDVLTMGAVFPRGGVIIGKKELIWVPIFGFLFKAAGNVLIDRKNRTKALAGLSEVINAIEKRKVSVWVFAEGTRNKSGRGLLPFKKGAFYMAVEAQIPVVAVVGAPIRKIFDWPGRRFPGGKFKVKVLAPVSTQGLVHTDIAGLMERVRNQMWVALDEIDRMS